MQNSLRNKEPADQIGELAEMAAEKTSRLSEAHGKGVHSAAVFEVLSRLCPEDAIIAAYARLCGGHGVKVTKAVELETEIAEAIAHDGPSLVEIITDADLIQIEDALYRCAQS